MPSKEQIKKFSAVFNRLDSFEASQRSIRGWGAWSSEEIAKFPDPDIKEVLDWLNDLSL